MISSKKSIIKGVIFDLDGTLIDTEPLSTKAIQRCIDSYNVKFPGIELKRKIIGLPGLSWTKMVIDACGLVDIYEPSAFLSDWEQNLQIICEEDGIMKMNGAEELTLTLKNLDIPMAIATSSRRESVLKKKQQHQEMFNRMNVIVCGDEVLNGKPSPDIFLLAASKLGLQPHECLVFEDSLSGVIAGKAANMEVIAVIDENLINDNSDFKKYTDHVYTNLNHFKINDWFQS